MAGSAPFQADIEQLSAFGADQRIIQLANDIGGGGVPEFAAAMGAGGGQSIVVCFKVKEFVAIGAVVDHFHGTQPPSMCFLLLYYIFVHKLFYYNVVRL